MAGRAWRTWRTGSPAIEAGRLDELRLEAQELRVEAALRAGHHRDVLRKAQGMVRRGAAARAALGAAGAAQYQSGARARPCARCTRSRRCWSTSSGSTRGPSWSRWSRRSCGRTRPDRRGREADPRGCPYRGLMPYDVDDADGFFGRDADIAACLRGCATRGVLAVVGPSGSGKSSLVRAGIAAALAPRRPPVVVADHPGARPMDALSAG